MGLVGRAVDPALEFVFYIRHILTPVEEAL
jgi:hypothetical protein